MHFRLLERKASEMTEGRFTIRVYGIIINKKSEVLVSDEIFNGRKLTKFPGGGLKQGEGTLECLKREIKEELGQEIEIGDHFYTSDFYQPSVFNPELQVICIYYLIKPIRSFSVQVKQKLFDFAEEKDGEIVFRWVALKGINKEPFTFENDRRVARMLHEKTRK